MDNKNPSLDDVPMQEEGWWASLLAEEDQNLAPRPKKMDKPDNKCDSDKKVAESDWQQARELFEQDEIIGLAVTGFNRGGLLVEGDHLYGFVPYSHLIDLSGVSDAASRDKILSAYVGNKLNLKVIECAPEDGRIVFSERAARSEAGRRTVLFETLSPGQIARGEVTNITDFGVFVDLGGVEGLVHISELSWSRVGHPSQLVELGQKLDVQVLEVSPKRCRVALSLKRLFDNPWETAEQEFSVNQIASARITCIVCYGAFAKLDKGLEGLIHVSEMQLAEGASVSDILQEGQEVQVRVLHVDANNQRMGLSLRLDPDA